MIILKKQNNVFNELDNWFQSHLGQYVSKEIIVELEEYLPLFHGKNLIQLGNCFENPWFKYIKIVNKWVVTPDLTNNNAQLYTCFNRIPIEANSIDMVIAPYTLDIIENKTDLLDEIDRILKPMGILLVFGLNPWGVWNILNRAGVSDIFNTQFKIKTYSSFKLNRYLNGIGYQQLLLKGFCYIPPLRKKIWIERLHILNEVGKILWPFPSGHYILLSQKYLPGDNLLASELSHNNLERRINSQLQPTNYQLDE